MEEARSVIGPEESQQFLQMFQEEWSRFREAGDFSTFEPTPSGTLIQRIENPTLIREGDSYQFTTDQRQWIGMQFQAPIYGSIVIPAPEAKPLLKFPKKAAFRSTTFLKENRSLGEHQSFTISKNRSINPLA